MQLPFTGAQFLDIFGAFNTALWPVLGALWIATLVLGWQLMTHLIAYARAEKLQQLHGSVLADNTTMLQMCRELGFVVEPQPGDAGVRTVCLQLG